MNNEIILDVPHNFYHTWHKSLEWFLERPGKEGELCTQIADRLSVDGHDTSAIIATLNCAYRNCISIYRMSLPQYNYSTKVEQGSNAFNSWGHSFTDQCITQILLTAQPEAKKSKAVQKLLARFDHSLYPEEFDPDCMTDLMMELWSIKRDVEEIDIDFTPCPDMIFVRSDIEAGKVNFTKLTNEYDHGRVKFLIDLMPTKEDKLYMLESINNAYHKWKPLPF